MKTIDTLGIIEHHLKDLSSTLYFQPPTDLLNHLPALIVEQSPPTHFSNNVPNPALSAKATISISALATRRKEALAACSEAFGRLFDSVHEVTELGWISRCTETQQPHLSAHQYEASTLFQYSAAVQVIFRNNPSQQRS